MRLHEKHGLNPAVPLCYFCQKQKNMVILAGAAIKDEAPQNAVWDKVPCDECAALMQQGIILISVRDGETDEKNPYRTGGWCVITEEALRRVITEDALPRILQERCAFVPDEAWAHLGLPRHHSNSKHDHA